MVEIKELLGKVITKIDQSNNELTFLTEDGTKYKMYHEQDCCEDVTIEDINGDLEDLIGSTILQAEEVSDYKPILEEDVKKTNEILEWGSCTWTFYKLATIKGYVTIRWFGISNGYYSESVTFAKV